MSHKNWNNSGRGKGKDSYQGFKPSSSSSATSTSLVIFNGGSAYDFALAKQRLKNKFVENKCWAYVEMPLPVVAGVAGALAVPGVAGLPGPAAAGAIIEDMFTIAKPAANQHAAQAIVQLEINEINNMYNQNDLQVQNLPISYERKQVMYYENDKKKRDLINDANKSVTQVLERLLHAVVQWDKDKALHDDRVAACLKVFTTYLGPGPLSLINNDLNHMRFRTAWYKLCTHYSAASGSQQSVASVISMLTNAVYVKNKTIQEHIEEMSLIASECTEVGGMAIPQSMVLEYILASIERSACYSDFEEDIKHIRRFGNTLLEAQTALQITQSNLAAKKTVEKMKAKRGRDADPAKGVNKEIMAAASLIVNNNKKKPKVSAAAGNVNDNGADVCKHCSKYHKSEKCWKLAVCDKCGNTGHIAPFCRTNLTKSENNKSTPVSVVGVFSKK